MKIYLFLEEILEKIIRGLWNCFIFIHEMKNIIKKRKLYKNITFTDEQKKEIDSIWIRNYGRKIPYVWHRLYQSYTGKFDPYYFPEYIYSLKIEPKFIKRCYCRAFGDKNLLDLICVKNHSNGSVRIPYAYVMCIDGVYYNEERKIINYEEVSNILFDIGEVILKKSVDSNGGKGVFLCNFSKGVDTKTKLNVQDTLNNLGDNWVVQERLKANSVYKEIYPYAINTIRVVTYILDDKVYHAPLAMRIGQGGNYLDNAHAGGMFIGVDDEGYLEKVAFTEYQDTFKEHPDTKFRFEGTCVPKVKDIINSAKELHRYLPKFKFISWDFCIDENENIVLIESNFESQSLWFPQMANGKSFFGNNTERMIQLARNT